MVHAGLLDTVCNPGTNTYVRVPKAPALAGRIQNIMRGCCSSAVKGEAEHSSIVAHSGDLAEACEVISGGFVWMNCCSRDLAAILGMPFLVLLLALRAIRGTSTIQGHV